MNLPVMFMLLSVAFLLQMVSIMCMFEDSSGETRSSVTFSDKNKQFSDAERQWLELTTTEEHLTKTVADQDHGEKTTIEGVVPTTSKLANPHQLKQDSNGNLQLKNQDPNDTKKFKSQDSNDIHGLNSEDTNDNLHLKSQDSIGNFQLKSQNSNANLQLKSQDSIDNPRRKNHEFKENLRLKNQNSSFRIRSQDSKDALSVKHGANNEKATARMAKHPWINRNQISDSNKLQADRSSNEGNHFKIKDFEKFNKHVQQQNQANDGRYGADAKQNRTSKKHHHEKKMKTGDDVYELKAFDGDSGSVRFEKRVGKSKLGQKEIIWFIRIKQILDQDYFTPLRFLNDIKKKMHLNEDAKDKNRKTESEEDVNMLPLIEKRQARHLLEHSEKEGSDTSSPGRDITKNGDDATKDNPESGSTDEEIGMVNRANPDYGSSGKQNEGSGLSEGQDLNSDQINTMKERLGNEETSFLLKMDRQKQKEDSQNEKTSGIFSPDKFIILDEAVKRLQSAYKIDFPRPKFHEDNDEEDDKKDDEESEKINDLISKGEQEEKTIKIYPATKVNKRSVQDVRGNYRVSVDDNEDDSDPNEFDEEVESDIKEALINLRNKERRIKRANASGSSSRPALDSTRGSGETEKQENSIRSPYITEGGVGEKQNKYDSEKEHPTKGSKNSGKSNVDSSIIGFIFFDKDAVKELKQVKQANTEQDTLQEQGENNELIKQNKRPCNGSHESGDKNHPCNQDHTKNHSRIRKTEHHVKGRTENHQKQNHTSDTHSESHLSGERGTHNNHAPKQSSGSKSNDSYLAETHQTEVKKTVTESFRVENHLVHGSGDVMIESISNEQASGYSGDTAHRSRHPGSSVHALVIVLIFFICFISILFVVVRYRSGGHNIREINSRTALYVPQAKY